MLTANGTNYHNGNGVHAKALYPPCASDYEERPVIDVTPTAPRPAWRDTHPLFVHHLEWIDSDGISHGLTLRSDDLQSLMADLRLVKSMIKQSKAKATQSTPQQATHDPEVPAADVPDVQQCRIHKVDMIRRWSKRTQGHYFAHKLPTGDFCYGRQPKA